MYRNRILGRSFRRRTVIAVIVAVIALTGLPMFSPAARAAEPQYSIGINPVLELLAGVQSQTDWIKQQGPRDGGSEYFHALQDFFAPYRDHPAMQICSQLLKASFSYDAPVAFALHLGPLPDLELEHEYSDYIVGRAGGREKLEEFRLALRDLAAESKFADFIQQWQPKYDEWTAKVASSFDGNRVIDWLKDFSGRPGGEYHMVLAPTMFPGGGYGATVTSADGRQIIYQVIRPNNDSGKEPVFANGRDLESLALHEWGHSFVNAAVDNHLDRVAGLWRFYLPVMPDMRSQAYSNVSTYAREQFLRGVTTLAAYELHGNDVAESDIARQEGRGFMLTRPIFEALKEYRANRAQYPTFDSYVPVVYDRIAKVPIGWPLPTLILALAVLGLGVFAVFRKRRQRKAREAR